MSLKSLTFCLALGATLIATPVGANHRGCVVNGYGPTVLESECTYVAPDDSQNVYVGTPNHWELYVLRDGCPSFPLTCTPKLSEDGCTPAPDNTCEPLRDGNGNVITQQRTVVLLEGSGIPAGPPPMVHPRADETVHVHIFTDCPINGFPPSCGAWGFIAAGIDEDHP